MQIGESGQQAGLPLSRDVEPVRLDTSDDRIRHTVRRQGRDARRRPDRLRRLAAGLQRFSRSNPGVAVSGG